MHKDQQEELQRLEEALLEEEPQEERQQVTEDTTALLLQEIYEMLEMDREVPQTHTPTPKAPQQAPRPQAATPRVQQPAPRPQKPAPRPAPDDYQVYNTDTTDVDMEEYSEALQEKPKGRGCLWSAIVFVIGALALTVWYLLKVLGVSP